MCWKSLVIAGMLCVLAAPAFAQPTLSVTSSYTVANGVEFEVKVANHGAFSLAIEAPFTLTPDTAGFAVGLRGNSGMPTVHNNLDANGAANQTWYYNQASVPGGVRLWNTQPDLLVTLPAAFEQNFGNNPFSLSETEGLWLDIAGNRLFAALGSDVGMPNPVSTLHIASNDGVLSWLNLLIAENNVLAATLTGFKSSIKKADMIADGAVNGLDVTPFVQALTNLVGLYNPAFPGLDGIARADINNDGAANGLDVTPFVTCVTGGGCLPGAGGGSDGGVGVAGVPEPSSVTLASLGVLGLAGLVRRNRLFSRNSSSRLL